MGEINPTQLRAWLDDPGRDKPMLLDVREPWEYEKARIEGSQLVPMREVPARMEEIDEDREAVAICHRCIEVASHPLAGVGW